VEFYIVINPYAEYVTYAFGMWLYKCSFESRSLNGADKANDQAEIFYRS